MRSCAIVSAGMPVLARASTHLVILALGLVWLTAPSPADARIGNPIKKAKQAVEKTVEPSSQPNASSNNKVVFDDVTVELTEERVQSIVTAYQKSAEAGAGRPALVAKRDQTNDEKSKILDKEGDAIRELQNKRDDVQTCYGHEYQAAQERRAHEYTQKVMSGDPALLEKNRKLAQEYNAAVQKGDSAATAKAQAALNGEVVPTREDSLQIRQKCGSPPPKSAAEKRLEDLDKQLASLDEQIRDIDKKVAAAQAKTGGLTTQQWGMATERIQMYLQKHGGQGTPPDSKGADTRKKKGDSDNSSSSSSSSSAPASTSSSSSTTKAAHDGYTDEEIKAIEKHLVELRGFLG